ncbi:Uncharacterized protein DAT39_022870, partial [Clarias magur]
GTCTTSARGSRRTRSSLSLLTTSPTSLNSSPTASTATRPCNTFWKKRRAVLIPASAKAS